MADTFAGAASSGAFSFDRTRGLAALCPGECRRAARR